MDGRREGPLRCEEWQEPGVRCRRPLPKSLQVLVAGGLLFTVSRSGSIQFHVESDRDRLDGELRDSRGSKYPQSAADRGKGSALGRAGRTLWETTIGHTSARDGRERTVNRLSGERLV